MMRFALKTLVFYSFFAQTIDSLFTAWIMFSVGLWNTTKDRFLSSTDS